MIIYHFCRTNYTIFSLIRSQPTISDNPTIISYFLFHSPLLSSTLAKIEVLQSVEKRLRLADPSFCKQDLATVFYLSHCLYFLVQNSTLKDFCYNYSFAYQNDFLRFLALKTESLYANLLIFFRILCFNLPEQLFHGSIGPPHTSTSCANSSSSYSNPSNHQSAPPSVYSI